MEHVDSGETASETLARVARDDERASSKFELLAGLQWPGEALRGAQMLRTVPPARTETGRALGDRHCDPQKKIPFISPFITSLAAGLLPS